MKKYCLLMIIASLFTWAQTPPQGYDPEIQALIDKVEKSEKKGVESDFKPEGDHQKAVYSQVERYFTSLIDEELTTSYELLSKGYKKYVTLSKYIGKTRLDLERVVVGNIEFSGEECAVAKGYMWGNQSSLGSSIKVPFREVFFLEDGEWRLFKNPFKNAMGIEHPFSKRFKPPCGRSPKAEQQN